MLRNLSLQEVRQKVENQPNYLDMYSVKYEKGIFDHLFSNIDGVLKINGQRGSDLASNNTFGCFTTFEAE